MEDYPEIECLGESSKTRNDKIGSVLLGLALLFLLAWIVGYSIGSGVANVINVARGR